MTYTVQHESAHFLGLHHPHDGTASVEATTNPVPDGSPFTAGSNWHYYYTMNKWQYDMTASPTTYGHTYGTYEVIDQDRLLYGRTSEYLKQAQDWLADAHLLEGAAGKLTADAALLSRQTTVTADRNQASALFQCGDYLHSQYAMRNAMLHAKGLSFAAAAPHMMSETEAGAAAAQPTDAEITDGHAVFAINPQTVYGPMASTCNAAASTLGGPPGATPPATGGPIGLPNTSGVAAASDSNTGLLALAGVGLLGAGMAVSRRRRRAA
jgi:LPXTG-motif cell wall-anchored protein